MNVDSVYITLSGVCSQVCHTLQRNHLSLASTTRPRMESAQFGRVIWRRSLETWVEDGFIRLDGHESIVLSHSLKPPCCLLTDGADNIHYFLYGEEGSESTNEDDPIPDTSDIEVPLDAELETDQAIGISPSSSDRVDTSRASYPRYPVLYCLPPIPDL